MKRKNILLNLLVASTLLVGGITLASCSGEETPAEEDPSTVDDGTFTLTLTISHQNAGVVTFYNSSGRTIDLTSDTDLATLSVGDTVSFRIAVNAGYNFESVRLNGSQVSTTTSSSTQNKVGNFNIVAGENTLVITFNEITTQANDFTYEYSDDGSYEATVTNYTCSTSTAPNPVVIPDTVTYDGNTYRVTGVASRAFSSYGAEVTSIRIPKYMRDLDNEAFYMAIKTLQSFVVDEENENFSVYEGVLYDKELTTVVAVPNGLTSVTLYQGVQALKAYAFANSAIQTFDIPTSVTTIGDYCFYSSSLTSISGGENLVTIGEWAFYYAKISSFNFGSNLETIGEYAFGETSLISVDLSNTKLTRIEDGVFYSTGSLKSITFSDDITYIGYEAFWNATFTSITLPSELIELEERAFNQSWSLKDITFNDKLEKIGAFCFDENISISAINLPDSVKYIGEGAFRAIPALGNTSTNFTIGTRNDNGYYKIEDGVLFEYNENDGPFTLHTYPMGGASEYQITEDVSVIKSYAFGYSRNIAKLTLNPTLSKIEAYAFYNIYLEETDITELELSYSGYIVGFESVTLEENWDYSLTIKDNVVTCLDGDYDLYPPQVEGEGEEQNPEVE